MLTIWIFVIKFDNNNVSTKNFDIYLFLKSIFELQIQLHISELLKEDSS